MVAAIVVVMICTLSTAPHELDFECNSPDSASENVTLFNIESFIADAVASTLRNPVYVQQFRDLAEKLRNTKLNNEKSVYFRENYLAWLYAQEVIRICPVKRSIEPDLSIASCLVIVLSKLTDTR